MGNQQTTTWRVAFWLGARLGAAFDGAISGLVIAGLMRWFDVLLIVQP